MSEELKSEMKLVAQEFLSVKITKEYFGWRELFAMEDREIYLKERSKKRHLTKDPPLPMVDK